MKVMTKKKEYVAYVFCLEENLSVSETYAFDLVLDQPFFLLKIRV